MSSPFLGEAKWTAIAWQLAGLAALSACLIISAPPAHAQGNEHYAFCQAYRKVGYNSLHHYIAVFPADNITPEEFKKINEEWKQYVESIEDIQDYYCGIPGYDVSPSALAKYKADTEKNGGAYHVLDWRPSIFPPQGQIKTYTLYYEEGEAAGHGYRNASIKLNYRFLLCADEIQVAYGIDRSSLTHDARYVVRMTAGRNFEYATPTSQPVAPEAVPINLQVVTRFDKTVAPLRDAAAGVSLGMGCFSGQTKRVGMLKALLGPTPTRTQIQGYLDTLALDKISYGSIASDLHFPLINAEFPAPAPAPAARRPAARKRG